MAKNKKEPKATARTNAEMTLKMSKELISKLELENEDIGDLLNEEFKKIMT